MTTSLPIGRIRAVAVAILLAVPVFMAPVPADAAPITFLTALPVARGQAVLRSQYFLIRSGTDRTSLHRDLTAQVVPIAVAVGVTPRLALFGIVAVLHKNLTLDTSMGRITRSASGFGDTTLFGRYTIVEINRRGETVRIAPFGGILAPTGPSTVSDRLGLVPAPLQPGSGAWGGTAGLVATWQTHRWELDADAGYQHRTEAHQFRFGDQTSVDLSFQYRVWPWTLGGGVPGFLYGVVETNVIATDENRLAGAADPDSGGTMWAVDLGLQYVTARDVLESALQLPAVQVLNGQAITTGYQLRAGIRWNVSLPFLP